MKAGNPSNSPDEIRIGVSACLLGAKVRFDGQHKLHQWISGTLGQFVTFIPACPEVDIGLGTPRETIRIELEGEHERLVAPKSGSDHTVPMERYARAKCQDLASMNLSGYILKKDSPSCGMERVRVYGPSGMAQRDGRGFFARALLHRFPLLPVEEEGRLYDPWLRENFLERVFAYRRLQTLFASKWSVGDLVAFHTREKFLLMAHEPKGYTALGRLVASAKGRPRPALVSEYEGQFMTSLAKIATVKKHCNVLQHMAGYFKGRVTPEDRQELDGVIEDYRAGLVPLVVPLTLIRHFVRRYGAPYLVGQTYLEPNPKELMLRNHV